MIKSLNSKPTNTVQHNKSGLPVWNLSFGIWNLFGISNLKFGNFLTGFLLLSTLLLLSCRQDMHDQAKYEPLEQSLFFSDKRSSREPVEGTVARGMLKDDDHLYAGKVNNEPAKRFPMELTAQIVERGQDRYNIYCAPCHDKTGQGLGMIVQRGFKQPPSFHIPRLREAPVGYYFDVITNGFGVMSSYAEQIKTEDRWAIIAYIRALQISQSATIAEVPEQERKKLEETTAAQGEAKEQ